MSRHVVDERWTSEDQNEFMSRLFWMDAGATLRQWSAAAGCGFEQQQQPQQRHQQQQQQWQAVERGAVAGQFNRQRHPKCTTLPRLILLSTILEGSLSRVPTGSISIGRSLVVPWGVLAFLSGSVGIFFWWRTRTVELLVLSWMPSSG